MGRVIYPISRNYAGSVVKPRYRGPSGARGSASSGDSGGGGGAFSPSQIAGLQLWLKANAITGLNDNDPVANWNDSSGNGRDLSQGTAASRPTFRTSQVNSLPAVDFDGTDDVLTRASVTNFIGSNAGHVFCVMRVDTSDAAHINLLDWRPTNDNNRLGIYPTFTFSATPNSTLMDWGDALGTGRVQALNVAAGLTGTFRLWEFSRNVNAANWLTNGISYATATWGDAIDPTESGTLFFAGAFDAGVRMDGMIAEFLLYNRFLSSTEQTQIRNHLNGKYVLF